MPIITFFIIITRTLDTLNGQILMATQLILMKFFTFGVPLPVCTSHVTAQIQTNEMDAYLLPGALSMHKAK